MIGNALVGVRTRQWAALSLGLLAFITAQTVSAADCPGHPGALGTSRTLVVDPRQHPRIGTMQYAETLPLNDHEVVLTFDDGPLPRNSNPDLERRFSGRRLAPYFVLARVRYRDQTAGSQGKRHSAASRYPGANRRRIAEDSA